MSSLELQGDRFTLYLEGLAVIHPSIKGDMFFEKNCHVGQGSISCCKTREVFVLFTFRTDRPTGFTPHGLAQLPDFTKLQNGDTWEMLHEKLKCGWPALLVDAYCEELLSQVRFWEKHEERKGKLPHHILIPHLVLSRLSLSVVEAGFPNKATPVINDE